MKSRIAPRRAVPAARVNPFERAAQFGKRGDGTTLVSSAAWAVVGGDEAMYWPGMSCEPGGRSSREADGYVFAQVERSGTDQYGHSA